MKDIYGILRTQRQKAAAYNDSLASMDSAAPQVAMSRSELQQLETGAKDIYPDQVLLMADVYHCPQLLHQFCTKICSIGRITMEPVQEQDIDGITVDALRQLRGVEEIIKTLLDTSADHKVTPDEYDSLKAVVKRMKDIGNIGTQLEVLLEEVKYDA